MDDIHQTVNRRALVHEHPFLIPGAFRNIRVPGGLPTIIDPASAAIHRNAHRMEFRIRLLDALGEEYAIVAPLRHDGEFTVVQSRPAIQLTRQ